MIRSVGFKVYGMYIEAKLEDLGGQRVRILGFYVDGKRTVPAYGIRQDVERALARALQTEWKGKFELCDVTPAVEKVKK